MKLSIPSIDLTSMMVAMVAWIVVLTTGMSWLIGL